MTHGEEIVRVVTASIAATVAALAACLLGASGYGQDADAPAKLAAFGKKASEVGTIHLFAYFRPEDRLDTDKPRVEEPEVMEVWYDAKNGLMRSERVKERSATTVLVNEQGAFVWVTRGLSPKVAGEVRRHARAGYLPSKDKLSYTPLGLAAFLLDALNGYSAMLGTCTVQPDAEKDEMGLENVTWFALTPDPEKDARLARELRDSRIRLAVDNGSGLAVCLRIESKERRLVLTVPRAETNVTTKDVFVLPPAVVESAARDAKTGKPAAD